MEARVTHSEDTVMTYVARQENKKWAHEIVHRVIRPQH
jgi:hypothetical protein